MTFPMVSIIIPVYNAEKYLKQCIESLLLQTFHDFEIICVDDGSTDRSYEILKTYEKKDKRIFVLQQKNQFAGVARNSGIKKANGKYLLFLDADDFFHPEMLEKAVEKAERESTEILVFDVFQYDNKSKKVITTAWKALNKNLLDENVKSAGEIAENIYDLTTPAPWNKLFLREFIEKNNLLFQSIQRTNDLFFVYAALSCAERIGVLNEKLLYYRDNNAESLQGSGSDTPEIFVQALKALRLFLKNRNCYEQYQKSFEKMALSIGIYNLNNMKEKEIYKRLCLCLKQDIGFGFGITGKPIERQLQTAINLREDLIIYGAGAVAKAMVDFLLFQCEYAKSKILVAVTNLQQNKKELCGLKVQEFQDLHKENKKMIIIAVAEEKIQNEIMNSVGKAGFNRYSKIGFYEIFSLVTGCMIRNQK